MYTAVAVTCSHVVICSHAVTMPPFAHVYKYIQGILTALTAFSLDGYGGIHAGVTKSGVKKEKTGPTKALAAVCSGDGK